MSHDTYVLAAGLGSPTPALLRLHMYAGFMGIVDPRVTAEGMHDVLICIGSGIVQVLLDSFILSQEVDLLCWQGSIYSLVR